MTAEEWFSSHVSRETLDRLHAFARLLETENERQNLIARSTLDHLWNRHILDSAQLADLASAPGPWIDVGSGGGLPGIVLAILRPDPIHLVEPRKLRAEFLTRVADTLGLDHVIVHAAKIERVAVARPAAAITARAVAPPGRLLAMTRHLADPDTCWILPGGRSAREEVARLRADWHGEFDLRPSITDPAASILIARGVQPRTRA